MKTGTHILNSGYGRTVMVKLTEDGSALLTVQTGLKPAQRVELRQSEIAALKDVLA